MHKAWSRLEEVLYCFSRSSNKFQGHMGQRERERLSMAVSLRQVSLGDHPSCPPNGRGPLNSTCGLRDASLDQMAWAGRFLVLFLLAAALPPCPTARLYSRCSGRSRPSVSIPEHPWKQAALTLGMVTRNPLEVGTLVGNITKWLPHRYSMWCQHYTKSVQVFHKTK